MIEKTNCPHCGSYVKINNYCTQCGKPLGTECMDITKCIDIEPPSNNVNVDVIHLQLRLLLLKLYI